MYEFIEGILESVHPTYLVINVSGVGYRLLTANPYAFEEALSEEIRVYVAQFIRDREGTIELFAFRDAQEKELFQTLNKVSGIGPKSALSILAANDHQGLVTAINQGDSKYLMQFPGVGKKTAQQMILDLGGELEFNAAEETDHKDSHQTSMQIMHEVSEALLGLGYSQREVERIEGSLLEANFDSTQAALSQAFKLLVKS